MKHTKKNLTSRLWDRAFSQAVDHNSRETYHIPGIVLMERAGHTLAERVRHVLTEQSLNRVVVLCGTGNNGGDGMVAARYFKHWNYKVDVILVSQKQPAHFSDSAAQQWKIINALGIPCHRYDIGIAKKFTATDTLLVDAVLGIGFKPPLKSGPLLDCLDEFAKWQAAKVVAVDLPSAMDCDDAATLAPPLRADYTVTFGGAKPALVMAPTRKYCGNLLVEDIGFPQQAITTAEQAHPAKYLHWRGTDALAYNRWHELGDEAHKYDRGHVLIVGGSKGKLGAVAMAAKACRRIGAGWISLAVDEAAISGTLARAQLESLSAEYTHENFYASGSLDVQALDSFLAQRRVAAVLMGPGCVTQPLTAEVVAVLWKFHQQGGFLVFDAGALQGIEDLLCRHQWQAQRLVLTPHPGEWLRCGTLPEQALAEKGRKEIDAFLSRVNATLIYKHSTPVIFRLREAAIVLTEGKRSLGKAGTGDVFAGLITAHGAVGYEGWEAVGRSLTLLSRAAQAAAGELGVDGLGPMDLLRYI